MKVDGGAACELTVTMTKERLPGFNLLVARRCSMKVAGSAACD